MTSPSVALLIYGDASSSRNALTEEKYSALAAAFMAAGYKVHSVTYNDDRATALATELLPFDAVLVWVNPVEQGNGRQQLDKLLTEVAAKGVFVSTHPGVILKMGTKDILYKTKDMTWGSDTKLYSGHEDFMNRFPASLQTTGVRVLKQYRGNGGNGVFKVTSDAGGITVIHATDSGTAQKMSLDAFNKMFSPFFRDGGVLIDQDWNPNAANGMVRCYVTGTRVSGFGYQEVNALYELNKDESLIRLPPSKRYYFTEHCGLFSDLKEKMEKEWIQELQSRLSIPGDMMPVIWDADFFINSSPHDAEKRYTLCEINVSCVSPFPPSSIPHIVNIIGERLSKK